MNFSTRGALNVSLGTGITVIGIAITLLSLSLMNGLKEQHEDTHLLEKELDAKKERLKTAKWSLSQAKSLENDDASKLKQENDALSKSVIEKGAQAEKLQQERQATLAANQVKVNEARENKSKIIEEANKALGEKRSKQQQQENFQAYLKQYEPTLVTIVSSRGHLGSGFIYAYGAGANAGIVIVTCITDLEKSADLAMKVKYRDASGTALTAATPLRAIYKDQESGLIFLVMTGAMRISVSGLVGDKVIAKAELGEKVYALGSQILGDQMVDNNVLDGEISSTHRQSGKQTLLQVSVPSNLGTCGAPLINTKGMLVGILLGPAEGLEKTSFAIPSEDLKLAMQRFEIKGGNIVNPAPMPATAPQRARVSEAEKQNAIKALDLPYNVGESLSIQWENNGRNCLIPTTGNLLVVWDSLKERLAAYKPQDPIAIWEFKNWEKNGNPLLVSSGPYSSKCLVHTNKGAVLEVNFLGGAAEKKGKLTKARLEDHYFEFGGMWFTYGPSTTKFILPSTDEEVCLNFPILIGQHGIDVLLWDRHQQQLGFADLNAQLPWVQKIVKISTSILAMESNPQLGKDQKLQGQNRELYDQRSAVYDELAKLNSNMYFADGLSKDDCTPCCVPNSSHVFVGLQCWDIQRGGVRRLGVIPSVKHSKSDEIWYPAFSSRYGTVATGVIAVSPSGNYALTTTHLCDAATFKPLVELPLPTPLGGFMSNGKTLFCYDLPNKRIFFWTLNGC